MIETSCTEVGEFFVLVSPDESNFGLGLVTETAEGEVVMTGPGAGTGDFGMPQALLGFFINLLRVT